MPKSDDPDEDFAQRNLEERIKPRHLRVVLAVQATGNMTKAGERLKLSQSSISKTISEVEETIGAQVFERRDKAWVTTEAGNKFVRMGLHVRNEIRILRDEINLLNRGHVGMVTIGVQSISAQPVMVKAISQVAKQFPNINIGVPTRVGRRRPESMNVLATVAVAGHAASRSSRVATLRRGRKAPGGGMSCRLQSYVPVRLMCSQICGEMWRRISFGRTCPSARS